MLLSKLSLSLAVLGLSSLAACDNNFDNARQIHNQLTNSLNQGSASGGGAADNAADANKAPPANPPGKPAANPPAKPAANPPAKPPANAPAKPPAKPPANSPAPSQSGHSNPQSEKFKVDAKHLPDVDFDIGESFAGHLPISNKSDEERKLFFWFVPSDEPKASDEIAIWLNGGPGCSSLIGFLSENGPFLWQAGQKRPTPNPYAWSRVTNLVWIEQPASVGYSTGTSNITNEEQLAEQFAGFWKNFVDTFKLNKRKVYINGESYAGAYIPAIAKEFLKRNDTEYYNVKGLNIIDPVIGNDDLQESGVTIPFVDKYNVIMNLNKSTVDAAKKKWASCGFEAYYQKYFTYPAKPLPWDKAPVAGDKCSVWSDVYEAAFYVNPCFDIYHITDSCPETPSVLEPDDKRDTPYFDRADVKKALNVDEKHTWLECTKDDPFGKKSDQSLAPGLDGTLGYVIDQIQNVQIGSGGLDFILPTEGILFSLQNVTWGKVHGFSKRPDSEAFFVPDHENAREYGFSASAVGTVGSWGKERGLLFYEVNNAGHMLPGYSKAAGVRALEVLLGRVPDLSSDKPLFKY